MTKNKCIMDCNHEHNYKLRYSGNIVCDCGASIGNINDKKKEEIKI